MRQHRESLRILAAAEIRVISINHASISFALDKHTYILNGSYISA